MTPAEIARAMGQYIRKHGFSPKLHDERPGCGCFIRAKNALGVFAWTQPALSHRIDKAIAEVAGVDNRLGETDLREAGWTEGATRDAAAACDIAADLLS